MQSGTTSYVCGTAELPLLGETLGDFLERACGTFASSPALVAPSEQVRLSFAQLREQVDVVARGLLALGLVRGDRLGIWSANRSEWVLTQLAAARVGVILVTINPAYREAEALHALRLSGCKAIVAQEAHKSSRYFDMLRSLTRGPDGNRLPQLRHVITLGKPPVDGWLGWDQLLQAGRDTDRAAIDLAAQFDDPINIQFTSGTTGSPKGATLSHHNILNNGFFVGETLRLTPQDRLCLCVPLYHCFGLVMGVLGALSHGACVVLAGEGFDPGTTLDTVQAERCTVLYGVPTMFVTLLEEQARTPRDLGSLRTGIMAGAPCPETVMRDVIDRMGMSQVTICYGMTETSPVSFQSRVDDAIALRVETVGQVHPHVEVKVVDPHGKIVPRGQPGELLTRGYSVMLGYWNDPDRTREAIDPAGWMHTGDLATIDEAGYCRIVGRIKDMLIRGGENIYPREVEEILYSHPDIAEAHVIGVPDPKFGEEVCAWVRLRDAAPGDATALRNWCRERMAYYKVPRYIEFVDGFPMTVTGKIQKHVMREEMTRRILSGQAAPH
jgi:fatty-acyl-CoA synthase